MANEVEAKDLALGAATRDATALRAKLEKNLRDLDGLTPELIAKLIESGVHTRDDLADLAVDELTDITGQSTDDAKALIMTARAHWFTDDVPAAQEQ